MVVIWGWYHLKIHKGIFGFQYDWRRGGRQQLFGARGQDNMLVCLQTNCKKSGKGMELRFWVRPARLKTSGATKNTTEKKQRKRKTLKEERQNELEWKALTRFFCHDNKHCLLYSPLPLPPFQDLLPGKLQASLLSFHRKRSFGFSVTIRRKKLLAWGN